MAYDPLRLEDSDFYIPASSCNLQVVPRVGNLITIKFQVATGSEFTTFCGDTMNVLETLGIYEEDSVLIIITNKFSHLIKVKRNNIAGNILGMDVLSYFDIMFSQGKITFS
jgi:hypothetical protein